MQPDPDRDREGRWSPPSEFDEYVLVRALGQGRMGSVYLAFDTLLARHVAVKFVASPGPGQAARDRFLIEARAVARLQHPNVVAIHRVGELDGQPYLISEFVRGETLDVAAKPMPWSRALDIGVDLARGLAVAHRHGVLHRDIKPANAIVAEDGRAKLIDFGLAKLLEEEAGARADERPKSSSSVSSGVVGPGSSPPARPTQAFGAQPNSGNALAPEELAAARAMTVTPEAAAPAVSTEGPGTRDEPAVDRADDEEAQPDQRTASTWPPSDLEVSRATTWPRPGRGAGKRAGPPGEVEGDEPDLAPSGEVGSLADARAAARLTRAGALMGTPDYVAPEIWRGEPATRRSDVYSLGVLLYELCAGRAPHGDVEVSGLKEAVLNRDAPPLVELSPEVDPRLAEVVHRCLSRDPQDRPGSGDALRDALEGLSRSTPSAAVPEGNPYRGLRPFNTEHRAVFFGRSAEIRSIRERLRGDPFVLVAGESGVGKSSVCRAGVLPLFSEGAREGDRTWSVLALQPGRQPIAAVAAALAPLLDEDDEGLRQRLREEPGAVVRALRLHLGEKLGLLVFLDQLEELATVADPDEAAAVDDLLGRLVDQAPGVRLLATARADMLARLAALPRIGEEMSRALFFLRPLSAQRIREVVVGPALATGLRFESEALVDELVEATTGEQGGLPLLQFALAEIWEARDLTCREITARALASLGGVAGALSRHADGVLERMVPRQREAARGILTRLVAQDGSRVRRSESELTADDLSARSALNQLVGGRLLVAHQAGEESAYEIASEVLLRGWPTLQDWLHASSDRRRLQDRLARAATEWERQGRPPDALWPVRQLSEAERVGSSGELPIEADYLAASRRAHRRTRLFRYAALAAVPALLLAAYGFVRLQSARELDSRVMRQVTAAKRHLAVARLHRDRAEKQRTLAYRYFDELRLKRGEKRWSRVLAGQAATAQALGRASRALEAALSFAPSRPELRSLFADVLLERALQAERSRRPGQRDELVQRLRLYDEGGARLARWNAPATLALRIGPGPAHLLLERYVSERGRLQATRVVELGQVARLTRQVPPGSYRVTLQAPGRTLVRYPVVLERGERLEVTLFMPDADRVPSGFVYVPPGRFLFGSTANEGLRRGFFGTVPCHPVRTGAYLIGKTEVTFGDWLAFLRALPKEQRRKRTPGVPDTVAVGGALRLWAKEPEGRWSLKYQPGRVVYQAHEGEMITYLGRTRRRSQNWLAWPVTAISAPDAEAYVGWLRRTGRVPGARLCTEREWERAARGSDDREYPHGHRLEPDDANFDETYGKSPLGMGLDEVSTHPASRSPFGLDDMSGNAWEWVRSSLEPSRYAGRGGAYFYERNTNRVTNRQVPTPTLRDATLGFRVCASVTR